MERVTVRLLTASAPSSRRPEGEPTPTHSTDSTITAEGASLLLPVVAVFSFEPHTEYRPPVGHGGFHHCTPSVRRSEGRTVAVVYREPVGATRRSGAWMFVGNATPH